MDKVQKLSNSEYKIMVRRALKFGTETRKQDRKIKNYRIIFKYCFLEKRGRLIFGSLRINMKKMTMVVLFANSNDIFENI
jgi:hypothetical protein